MGLPHPSFLLPQASYSQAPGDMARRLLPLMQLQTVLSTRAGARGRSHLNNRFLNHGPIKAEHDQTIPGRVKSVSGSELKKMDDLGYKAFSLFLNSIAIEFLFCYYSFLVPLLFTFIFIFDIPRPRVLFLFCQLLFSGVLLRAMVALDDSCTSYIIIIDDHRACYYYFLKTGYSLRLRHEIADDC
jgi:hypothetical protein